MPFRAVGLSVCQSVYLQAIYQTGPDGPETNKLVLAMGPPAASVSSKALPFCCASIAFLSKAMPFRAVLLDQAAAAVLPASIDAGFGAGGMAFFLVACKVRRQALLFQPSQLSCLDPPPLLPSTAGTQLGVRPEQSTNSTAVLQSSSLLPRQSPVACSSMITNNNNKISPTRACTASSRATREHQGTAFLLCFHCLSSI
eukprot:SAG22_NODE_2019_length_3129_cov_1.934653_6_plen_199_part_00